MLARRFLGLSMIFICDAYDFETGLFVSREVGVINDSTRAEYPDSLVEIARQFRFVIEMRENISHYRSPLCESWRLRGAGFLDRGQRLLGIDVIRIRVQCDSQLFFSFF